ncbi:MAG: hypothetical protein QXT58_03960, partial [Archaeoglobaceae archaeon]
MDEVCNTLRDPFMIRKLKLHFLCNCLELDAVIALELRVYTSTQYLYNPSAKITSCHTDSTTKTQRSSTQSREENSSPQ